MFKKVLWLMLVFSLATSLVSAGMVAAQDNEKQPPPPAGFFVALGDMNARLGQNVTLNCTDSTDGSTCRMTDERLNWKWSWDQFPDSAIGCPQAFAVINPVQTSGYVFTFTWQDIEYNYHQDGFGQAPPFLCVDSGREDITTTGINVTACSAASQTPVSLVITNDSSRTADLYWVDFNCAEVFYQTVPANGTTNQSTFTGHVWIVRDSETTQLVGQITAESTVTTLHLAAANPAACTPEVPTRLSAGSNGKVTSGLSNNIRVSPGLNNTKVGEIPAAATFSILTGPVCADNMSWWQVNFNGLVGWTAEGKVNDYWLEPAEEAAQIPNATLLNYDDSLISFSYNPTLTQGGITVNTIAEVPYDASQMPLYAANPAYTEYALAPMDAGRQPVIRVYRTADFEAFTDRTSNFPMGYGIELETLKSILSGQVDLASFISPTNGQPGLPYIPAGGGQVLFSHAQVMDFVDGSGIRYLMNPNSMAVMPVVEGDLLYVFQGISEDGSTYVSITLPFNTGVLPAVAPADFDTIAENDYESYLADIQTALDTMDTSVINPFYLPDEMVSSILVK